VAEVTPEEIAEALVCLAKLILLLKRLEWLDDVAYFSELEDELSDLHQGAR
jgi:hypothetical protein